MSAMSKSEHGGHGEDAHGEDAHGEHGEGAAPLAPINWAAWGAGALCIGAGLVVALCLYVATSL